MAQGIAPAAPAWQPPFAQGMGPAASPATDLTHLLPVNRDGFAIASGYFGLISIIPNPFTSIPAILCGVLGLHRLKGSTKLGRGRAWFGLIAGVLSLLVFVFAFALARASSPDARSRAGSRRHVVVSEGPDVTPATGGTVGPTSNADSVTICRSVLDSLGAPPPMRVDADFITLVRSYSTPSVPQPGYENVQPNRPLGRYPDVESYLRADHGAGGDVSARLLNDNGFVYAAAATFDHGGNEYRAEGIQFRNSTAADHYNRVEVLERCQAGLVSHVRPSRTDGVSFVRVDDGVSARASFVIGSTVIHLDFCSCYEGRDLQGLVDRWAGRIEERSAGSSQPNVDVGDALVSPGSDATGSIARRNLDLAAVVVLKLMRSHPDRPITRSELAGYNATFTWNFSGLPLGKPGAIGAASVGTYITAPPGTQYVVIALPGSDACYYVAIELGHANTYGVSTGAVAASDCFIGETPGGAPDQRVDIQWGSAWPAG